MAQSVEAVTQLLQATLDPKQHKQGICDDPSGCLQMLIPFS
jgi:hypothetical protein